MTRSRRALTVPAIAVVVALALVGCSGDDPGDAGDGTTGATDRTGAVLAGLADDGRATYEDLSTALDDLGARLTALCAAPAVEGVADAQASWRAAALAWQASRPFGVGPAMDARLMADVGFAARADPIDALLAGSDAVDEAGLADAGSARRGIFAIEHVLFGPAGTDLPTAAGARPCTYVAANAALAADAAGDVLDAWSGPDGYRDELAAGLDGDPVESVAELTNQVIACLGTVDVSGLRDLAEAPTLDDAPTARRDGPARFVMAQHRALVEASARVLVGDEEAADDGLVALVRARSPETADALESAAADAVVAMELLPDSADEAWAESASLAVAADAVAALRVLVATEVASQLGVTVRLSDADGDS